jgi:hypothetical protein
VVIISAFQSVDDPAYCKVVNEKGQCQQHVGHPHLLHLTDDSLRSGHHLLLTSMMSDSYLSCYLQNGNNFVCMWQYSILLDRKKAHKSIPKRLKQEFIFDEIEFVVGLSLTCTHLL